MDELRRAMLDAGAPRDEWQAELPFLIEAGQKRVRRRRMIATGVAAAVITAVGTTAVLAGVPGLNKSEPEPVKDRHSGVYVEERISPAEVERRCNIVINNERSAEADETYVAGVDKNGRGVPAAESVQPPENRVGHTVVLVPRGAKAPRKPTANGMHPAEMRTSEDPEPIECAIPQEDALESAGVLPADALPTVEDVSGIADACARFGGYDVRGWELLVAARLDVVQAIFMSENGYAVLCSLWPEGIDVDFYDARYADDDGVPLLPKDDQGRRDPSRYSDIAVVCGSVGGAASVDRTVCSDIGLLPGLPDGYRVEVTLSDGSVQSTTTKRGAYAIRFEVPPAATAELPVRVRAPDGVVIWRSEKTTPSGGGGGVGQQDKYPVPPAAPPTPKP